MRLILLIALLPLTACNTRIDQAEKRYSIVMKEGDAAKTCPEGKRLLDAYLDAGDADGYRHRSVETEIDCQSARLTS